MNYFKWTPISTKVLQHLAPIYKEQAWASITAEFWLIKWARTRRQGGCTWGNSRSICSWDSPDVRTGCTGSQAPLGPGARSAAAAHSLGVAWTVVPQSYTTFSKSSILPRRELRLTGSPPASGRPVGAQRRHIQSALASRQLSVPQVLGMTGERWGARR